jgi:uncharacterized membrane protein
VKLFSAIAGIALVLAAVFFLKYSVEHGWLSPMVRATLGLVTGIALLVICELRVARNYAVTANAMHGAGIAILYATLFAIHAVWHLLPSGVVFVLMLAVTAVAVMLSIRRDSVFIALLGLVGGFATPALLSATVEPISLFLYLLLLNVGLAWIAYRKRWPVLTAVSLVYTVIYQWWWTVKFLATSQLSVAATIFAVFAILSASALWFSRKFDEDDRSPVFERTALIGTVLPLLFALFTAAVPVYGARYNILFGFLLLIVGGLAVVAIARGLAWLHMVGSVATLLTFAIWSAVSYTPAAWPKILIWIAVFILLHLGVATRLASPATYAAGILFAMFPILLAAEPGTASPEILFGTLFVLLAIVAAFAIRYGQGPVFFIASFFAIVAEAVWSVKHLDRDRLLSGLLVYAAFSLLFIGVPAIARRLGRTLEPQVGVGMTTILSLVVMAFLTFDRVADGALWGLAALLAIVIAGTFIESRAARKPVLAVIAVVLSWIVLALWWEGATLEASLIPALFVVAALGVVVLLGLVWLQRERGMEELGLATHLGLIGHLFLMFVASQPDLAFPPWPLFAVLALLDLAAGVVALYLRRGSLMIGAAAASQVVLFIWAGNVETQPWANVALVAPLVIAAFAGTWYAIAKRRVSEPEAARFAQAAIVALVLGHFVAMTAGFSEARPAVWAIVLTHALLSIGLLTMAWVRGAQELAAIASGLAVLATMATRSNNPSELLLAAAVPYALFIAYPLLVGARAKQSIAPYIAAVLASAAFFGFAYDALVQAGYKDVIGALPLFEAIVLVVVLVRALRIDPPGERTLNRLALTAGAALGFVTLAIPLQLDKEWITIAWALEGAALMWLFTRIPHRGLLAWGGALLLIVFVRLVFNQAVFSYHPTDGPPIVNWYLYTYLICAAAFFAASYYVPRGELVLRGGAAAGGAILLFVLLNIEIADFYSTGSTLTFNFFSSSLAQELTYTIGWAVFAVGMLVAGIILHARAARISALALLVVTVLKCFLHDLGRLGGLYRVGSLLGLAISLVLVGVLLQKFVMAKTPQPTGETP